MLGEHLQNLTVDTMSMTSSNTSFSTILSSSNSSRSITMVPTNTSLSTETNGTWIIYSGSIISGAVLLELIVVLLMVVCRKYQIRRKERIEQKHVYHVRRGERRSNFDFTGSFASRSTKNTCVVSEVEPQQQSNISYNVVTLSPSGPDEAAACRDGHTLQELKPLTGDEVTAKGQATDTQLKQKEHPKIIIEEPIPVAPNSSYEPATGKSTTRASPNFSALRQLSLGDQDTNGLNSSSAQDGAMLSLHKSSKKSGVAATSLSVDQLEVDQESDEMGQAFEVLDELQKQIHILSQSIPMLDVYGNEIVKPAAPEISRSIPTLLDMAGYEDIDTNQAQAFPMTKRKPKTKQLGVDIAGYEDLDAVRPHQAAKTRRHPATEQSDVNFGANILTNNAAASTSGSDHEKSSPLVSPHTIEPLHTGVQKKQSTRQEGGENKGEPVYSVVQKKPKAFSVSDLTEEPPPVPPMTAEALYTALQKPKKISTRYYSAIITDESLPQMAACYDRKEENPPIKASISMEQILKEEVSKSGTLSSIQQNQEMDCFRHPSTVESTYPRTYVYEDELQTDL